MSDSVSVRTPWSYTFIKYNTPFRLGIMEAIFLPGCFDKWQDRGFVSDDYGKLRISFNKQTEDGAPATYQFADSPDFGFGFEFWPNVEFQVIVYDEKRIQFQGREVIGIYEAELAEITITPRAKKPPKNEEVLAAGIAPEKRVGSGAGFVIKPARL